MAKYLEGDVNGPKDGRVATLARMHFQNLLLVPPPDELELVLRRDGREANEMRPGFWRSMAMCGWVWRGGEATTEKWEGAEGMCRRARLQQKASRGKLSTSGIENGERTDLEVSHLEALERRQRRRKRRVDGLEAFADALTTRHHLDGWFFIRGEK